MIIFLIIFSYDSIPPLPNLSEIIFPEPALWIEPVDNYLSLMGYAGNFNGGDFNLKFQQLHISGLYEQKCEWDSMRLGNFTTAYSLLLPHLWLKPSIDVKIVEREKKYILLNPGLSLSSTISWAIISGQINYDQWQINRSNYIEEIAKLDIIFDKMVYLPQLELSEIYSDKNVKPAIAGRLHLRNFHLGVGSPIFYGFPSPSFEIQYLAPEIKFETEIKSGVVFQSLKDFFNPEIPIRYTNLVPEESLRIGISIGIKYERYGNSVNLMGAYKNFNKRLVLKDNYEIGNVRDVREANITLYAKNRLADFSNSLCGGYNFSDSIIPFLPKYDILDTLKLDYKFLKISAEARYLSERNGITKILDPCIIISPTIGLNYKYFLVFLSVYNITDKNEEIYDNYRLKHRQFAGGLKFNYRF